jgi:glyoxylase-like metal-dependent hydrolase (beta-lactamase superfamily II)
MKDLRELRRGLWRWTAPHPAWRPGAEPDSVDDWPEEVGCVAYAAAGALVLVDPLVPDDDWPILDRLVRDHGPAVHVVTTLQWHRRSGRAIVERYGAATSRARAALPAGVEPIRLPRTLETMVWLPGPRALIPGDRLIAGRDGGVRPCPESWLPRGMDAAQLRAALRVLLDLPVAMVLVSHGRPVLRGGASAIARALDE